MKTQHTPRIDPMLVLRWASVADGGPAYNQHWVNASCLLGRIHVVSTLVLKIASILLSHVLIFSRVEMLVDCRGGGGGDGANSVARGGKTPIALQDIK